MTNQKCATVSLTLSTRSCREGAMEKSAPNHGGVANKFPEVSTLAGPLFYSEDCKQRKTLMSNIAIVHFQ